MLHKRNVKCPNPNNKSNPNIKIPNLCVVQNLLEKLTILEKHSLVLLTRLSPLKRIALNDQLFMFSCFPRVDIGDYRQIF